MYYNHKKELIKNVVTMTFILTIAIVSTYIIYNKFDHSEIVDYSSESLDITFKEEMGDEINITNVSPVTDSVGLSSKAHTITIKNNLTEATKFIINWMFCYIGGIMIKIEELAEKILKFQLDIHLVKQKYIIYQK